MKLYVNGILVDSTIAPSLINDATKLLVGNWNYSSPRYFRGSIDDIRIYKRTLDSLEITNIYNDWENKPTLVSPDNNYSFTINTLVFLWNQFDSATTYRLQISPFSNFSLLTYNQTTADTFLTTSALPNNWYFWRVKAYSATDSSEWSEVRSFSVATSTVGIPALTFPPADTVTNDSFPDFDWADVAGATQYELQVGKGNRWAYLANSSSGLEIYNISDTANVYQISPYSGSGIWCNKMTLQDTLLPISCYSTVKLYNVADPRNPVLRSTVTVNNYCVLTKGTYLYIGDQNYGLWVYDISNPASPALAARFDTTNRVRDLAISGTII
ncbi:MAG: LamG-like jellyroll fold domain-containing protein, partial [Saprospiraceae bacterium]|nr:LamG-like jellyroll fold domain-containing protein [Saprospiraceae bacterium]